MWEYMTATTRPGGGFLSRVSIDTDNLDDGLNEIGAEGWELVSAFDLNASQGRSDSVVLIFKRPKA